MKQENLNTLIKLYNTLLLVNTKGEDTLTMSDCLRALAQLIVDEQKQSGEQVISKEE